MISRRRFLFHLPIALAALPATALAQSYPAYEELPKPKTEPTMQSFGERITRVEIAQSTAGLLLQQHADVIADIQECVSGCHLIMPEDMEL